MTNVTQYGRFGNDRGHHEIEDWMMRRYYLDYRPFRSIVLMMISLERFIFLIYS